MENKDKLIGRLENWKFESAFKLSENMPLTYKQRELIARLCDTFQNCGWFDGYLGGLVASVVSLLCKDIEACK